MIIRSTPCPPVALPALAPARFSLSVRREVMILHRSSGGEVHMYCVSTGPSPAQTYYLSQKGGEFPREVNAAPGRVAGRESSGSLHVRAERSRNNLNGVNELSYSGCTRFFFALPVTRSDFPCRNGFFGQGAYGFSTFFSGTDFLRRRGMNDLLGESPTAIPRVLFPASVRVVSRPVPPSPLRRVHHRRFRRLPPSFLPRKGKAGPGLPAFLAGGDGERHDP